MGLKDFLHKVEAALGTNEDTVAEAAEAELAKEAKKRKEEK